MSHEFTRREFNRVAASLPLLGIPLSSSVVTNKKSLQVQHGVVCVDGRKGKDDWQLVFFIRVVQKLNSDPRCCRTRIMLPTDAFADRLKERGFNVVRHTSKRLIADRVSLPNGVASLCLMLDAAFPADQQDELWIDPTPEGWGEYVVPCNRVVKRFWVGEA